MRFTDMADEMFGTAQGALPAGVRLATAKRGGVTITRVEIAREGLAKPRGRYVTLEMPSVSVLDERDAAVIEVCARELRALLPPKGPVLVLGVGNRRITADALGPRTVQFSDSGLYPAQVDHTRHLTRDTVGVPVVAAGIPTLMQAQEGADLVVTPRALDSVIAHGAALLACAVNRALQPRLTVQQLCWLTG